MLTIDHVLSYLLLCLLSLFRAVLYAHCFRRKVYHTDQELKATLQAEWDKITLEEIRERISTMSQRYKTLARNSGKAIKTALW